MTSGMNSGGNRIAVVTAEIHTEINKIMKKYLLDRTTEEHLFLIKYKYNDRLRDYMFTLGDEKVNLL